METKSFGENALGGIVVKDNSIHAPPHPHHRAGPMPGGPPPGTPTPHQRQLMGPPAAPYSAQSPARPPPHMMPSSAAHPIRPGAPGTPIRLPPGAAPPQGYRHLLPKPGTPPSSAAAPPGGPGIMRGARPQQFLAATPQNLATMNPEQVSYFNCVSLVFAHFDLLPLQGFHHEMR